MIFPPILVRLLARDGKYGKAMTSERIAERANMLVWDIEALAHSTDWSRVQFGYMTRFLGACNFDFDDTEQMRRVFDYLRKNPNLTHIRKSELWDDYYKPMLIRWRRSCGMVTDLQPWYYPPPLRALLIRLNPLLKGAV